MLQVVINFDNYYANTFGATGLVYNQLYFFLLNAFLSPLIQLIDPARRI